MNDPGHGNTFTSTDGLELFYRDHGCGIGGTPVICLPGLTRNSRDFVDVAAIDDWITRWRALNPDPDAMDRVSALLGTAARMGLGRLISGSDFGDLPARSRDEMRAAAATELQARGTVEEYLKASTSGGQAAWLEDLGSKPLVVLTAGVGTDAAWVERREELATLSDESEHRLIEGADHSALIHDQEHSAATSDAILDVVASVRDKEPLAR